MKSLAPLLLAGAVANEYEPSAEASSKFRAWSSNNDSSDGYMPLALIDQYDEKFQASSGFGGLLNQESIVPEFHNQFNEHGEDHHSMTLEEFSQMKKEHAQKYLETHPPSVGPDEHPHYMALRTSHTHQESKPKAAPEVSLKMKRPMTYEEMHDPLHKTYLQYLGEREQVSPQDNVLPEGHQIVKPKDIRLSNPTVIEEPVTYAHALRDFLDRDGLLFWTIVFNVSTILLVIAFGVIVACHRNSIIEMWSPTPSREEINSDFHTENGPLLAETSDLSVSSEALDSYREAKAIAQKIVDKQIAKKQNEKEEVNNELTRDATHETDESGD